jgi:hypothetical protein
MHWKDVVNVFKKKRIENIAKSSYKWDSELEVLKEQIWTAQTLAI